MSEARAPGSLYWGGTLLLIVFGALTGFSIGIPFLVVGLALVFLAPFRGRTRVFVSVLVGVVAFFAGFILIAPMGCTSTMTVTESPGGGRGEVSPQRTVCDNILGIDYSGTGLYNPPLWPATLAGLVVAGVATTATSLLLKSRQRDPADVL